MKQTKLFFLMLVLGLFMTSTAARAQAVGDYGSAASGNWGTDGTNWVVCVTDGTWDGATVASIAPTANDNVWIRSGHTITAETTGKVCKNLTIASGPTSGTGGTIISTSASGANNVTLSGTTLAVQANATYQLLGTASNFGTAWTNVVLDNASTIEFAGTQGSLSTNTGTLTFGNLIWSAGTLTLAQSATAVTLVVNGNLTINKTATTTGKIRAATTNFAGTITHTVYGDLIMNNSSATNHCLSIVNSAPSPANVTFDVKGNVTLNSGKITMFESSGSTNPTATLNVGGNLTIGSAAVVQFGSNAANAGTAAINIKGNIINNNPSASGNTAGINKNSGGGGTFAINLNGTSDQQWTGLFPAPFTSTLCSVNINNPAGMSLNNAVTVNALVTLTVNDGSILKNAYTLTNSNVTNINGSFQLDEGGWATGTDFVYGAASTLVFNNSSGFYGVSGTPVFWPTTNGPVNVTVQNLGGLELQLPRSVTGIFQISAGVKNTYGNDLTVSGTVKLNSGGYFDNFSPTYTNTSTLEYNTGDSYVTYNEWIEGSTVGYGVPQNVTLSNATSISLSGNRTISGNLILSSGDISANNFIINLAGTTTGSGSILTGTTGTVTYMGTAQQTISNLKDNAVNQLTISNTAGVTLSAPTTMSGLFLANGNLSLGAYDLTINSPNGLMFNPEPATIGHIVTDGIGKFIQFVNPGTTTPFSGVFPVGTSATSYDPVKLVPAAPALFAVNVGTTLPADAPAKYTYAAKVWDISVMGPPSPTLVTLTPSNPVSTITSDVIGHYEGGTYTNVTATRSVNDYTATFTSFSPFVTGTYDVGTSVSSTAIDGIRFDGRMIYNPSNTLLQVYDAAGKLTVSSTKNINMSSHPKGIYIVKSQQGTQKIAVMK